MVVVGEMMIESDQVWADWRPTRTTKGSESPQATVEMYYSWTYYTVNYTMYKELPLESELDPSESS